MFPGCDYFFRTLNQEKVPPQALGLDRPLFRQTRTLTLNPYPNPLHKNLTRILTLTVTLIFMILPDSAYEKHVSSPITYKAGNIRQLTCPANLCLLTFVS